MKQGNPDQFFEWNNTWNPLNEISNKILKAQLHVLWSISTTVSQITEIPHLDISWPLWDIIEWLKNYRWEENLIPKWNNMPLFAPLDELIKGVNSYHIFLEWQKVRRLSFEATLAQVQVIKTVFSPYLLPTQKELLQQAENFCKTNLAFTFSFHRPDWNLDIKHEAIADLDFCTLEKFEAPEENPNGRSIMLIAPMSGHFATLLRKTVESLHKDGYTVYITDWKSPFDIPWEIGEFGIEGFTEELLNCFNEITNHQKGEAFEVLAVCQPWPETMTAVAYAEKHGLPKPESIGLMASPIDVSKNPTAVNEAGEKLTPEIMDSIKFVIPSWYPWAGREVYLSAMQISMFIMTKPEEHMKKFLKLAFKNTPHTTEEQKELDFYKEFFSWMDLSHQFYKETNIKVFQENRWAKWEVTFLWEKIDFSETTTPIITFEGREDDICGIGQTQGANKAFSSAKINKYYLIAAPVNDIDPITGKQKRVGHYGVFAGNRFREDVIPTLKNFYDQVGSL